VAAGTYTEVGQIVIGKDLTVVGAGAGSTIIRPSADTGSSGDARGWFLVNPGMTFNLNNATLDGTGRKVWQAIRNHGQGTVSDCAFTNIQYEASGPSYAGIGMAVFGSPAMNVDVTNCTFSGIGRVGVLYFGSGVTDSTFSGNTYTGKGAGNWLDYAVEVGAGATATISGNTISGNTGVATADGSTSAGILVTTFYGAGTTADITENFISGSTTGVAVGYDASDTSVATVHRNSITGNGAGVANVGPGTLNAECNWWGGITGAVAPNNTVSGNVDTAPWLTTSDLSGACFGGTWTFQGFFSPVDNLPTLNLAKAPQIVPVKWRILDGTGVPINDLSSFVSLKSEAVPCSDLTTAGSDPLESYSNSSGLLSKGDGNWQFNWATPSGYAGTCRILILTLADGSTHIANFKFK
jgi:hypothetical protein